MALLLERGDATAYARDEEIGRVSRERDTATT
jgi:hypothetical protein